MLFAARVNQVLTMTLSLFLRISLS